MRGNPFIQFGHHPIVRHQLPAISRIDAPLKKGHQVGFAFGNSPDSLRREIGSTTSLRGGHPIDKVQRSRIQTRGDDSTLAHQQSCILLYSHNQARVRPPPSTSHL